MGKARRIFYMAAVTVILAFCLPGRVQAEEWEGYVKNYAGETIPWGDDVYLYKYWTGTSWAYSSAAGTDIKDYAHYVLYPDYITYDVTYNYEEAYKMLDMVNAERRKAGVPELKMNDKMMELAMERAAETAFYWSHTRPDGTGARTKSDLIDGENIYTGSNEAADAMNSWITSSGHYATMLDSKWKYAGFGCVNGDCWVQVFTNNECTWQVDGYKDESKKIDLSRIPLTRKQDYSTKYTVAFNPNLAFLFLQSIADAYRTGDVIKPEPCINGKPLPPGEYTVVSLTPEVCRINASGEIECTGEGIARVQVIFNQDASFTGIQEFEVKKGGKVKKGQSITQKGQTYKVLSTKAKTVAYTGPDGSGVTSVTVPDTIKVDGKAYKVTEIAARAFKGSVKLKSAIIGKNVEKIGKEAFQGCKSLKKITVKSMKLKAVGKDALKGIHKKAAIHCPAKKLAAYQKVFQGRGQKKTVRIK